MQELHVIGQADEAGQELEPREQTPEAAGAATPGMAANPDVTPDPRETVPDAELESVRELIVRAYPDIVPELLAGESVGDLIASVPAARAAYARVAESVRAQPPAPIPAGGGRRPPHDPDSLPPEVKIRIGLRG